MKISWETQSPAMYAAITDCKLLPRASGGDAYDFLAASALADQHSLKASEETVRKNGESIIALGMRLRSHRSNAEIVIKSPMIVALGINFPKAYQIGMIHHLDEQMARESIVYLMYLKLLKRRLKQMDCIVCVSEFWKEAMEKLGCSNIKVIYNSFDPSEFEFEENEIADFKNKYNIKNNAPLIYVGNATKGKGTEEVCAALKNKGYNLISSGPIASDTGPARCLSLERREYLLLLCSCDIVLTMSTMPEGWNRTAHEAMLCKTPVIGSGSGGMKELLQNGGQVICSKFGELPEAINPVLVNADEYGKLGYDYVKKYDLAYFSNAWNGLIENIELK